MPLMNAPFPQPIIDQLASMDPKARRSALLKIKRSYAGFQANQFLIQMLATEEKDTNRALIIQILGERKWTAVVDALIEVLQKDESKKVRLEAVSVLCTLQDRRAVDVLLMALVQDKSMNVREKAAHALGEWQEQPAIQTLENLLAQTKGKSSYASLRKEMAWALGQFGDPDLVMPLLKNEHHWVRDEAVTALARMHDPQVIEPLLDFLSNPMESGTVRHAALIGLSKLQDERIIPALIFALEYRFSTESSGRGNLAADILKEYSDLDLCAVLLTTLQNTQLATPRWEAIRLLGDIGDQRASAPLLAHVLAHEQWYLDARRGAYGHSFYNVYEKFRANSYIVPEALSKLCTEETFMQLLELLNAPTSVAGVRDLCSRTLALLLRPESVKPLLVALADPRNIETIEKNRAKRSVRETVVYALECLAPMAAAKPLLALLADPDVTEGEVRSVVKVAGTRAVESLLALLEHRKDLANCILEALCKLDDPRSYEALFNSLQQPCGDITPVSLYRMRHILTIVVKEQALDVLLDALPTYMLPMSSRDGERNRLLAIKELANAIEQIGDWQAVKSLRCFLQDSNADVRAHITGVLNRGE